MLSESTPAGIAADDFEAIEKAVMDSRRGRWFLDEYVKRRGGGDTKTLLAAMDKLENTVAAGNALIAERVSKALGLMTSLDAKSSAESETAAPMVALAEQHMKFFKQDEELFEAPAKLLGPKGVVTEIRKAEPKPETAKGAKLVIRHPQSENQIAPIGASAETPDAVPATLAADASPKKRIVIIRHNTTDLLDVPLHEEFRASA